jgi:hypothetical protein
MTILIGQAKAQEFVRKDYKMKTLVVIPHSRTVKWAQIVISSIKKFKNDHTFDIMFVNNSPVGDNSLLALTETGLSENIIMKENEYFQTRAHAGALDYALTIIDEKEYPYFFSAETDCAALKENWIDWFHSFMTDPYQAMVGWYWPGGDREYIHTGGCLYNTAILKRIKKQIQENDNYMMCYGTDLKRRMFLGEEGGPAGKHYRDSLNSPFHGPFTEQRGFQEIWSKRDHKYYQEPGAWPYYRCQVEYECIKVPGALIYNENPHVALGTFYGSNNPAEISNAYWAHYWAGTVSHNWEIMRVIERWQRLAIPVWVKREDRLWCEMVPENIRKKTIEMGLAKTGADEMSYVMNHPNIAGVKPEEVV